MIAANIQPNLKRIEDLSLREIDMVYSLSRIGRSCPEIGKRYRISESDVRKVVEDYVELRELCKTRPPGESQRANPETTKKPRKRRCDAIYATAKERQAAYVPDCKKGVTRVSSNRHQPSIRICRFQLLRRHP